MTTHRKTSICAADLAERIVQEISEAGQDWHAIELLARELVGVLVRLAPGSEGAAADRRVYSRR